MIAHAFAPAGDYVTYLLILVTTLSTVGAQLLLKQGLRPIGALAASARLDFLVAAVLSPWVWAALVLQVFGYVVWFFVLMREKLGVAFAISGSFFYLVMALLSWALFDEALTPTQWTGIALISAGVLAVERG